MYKNRAWLILLTLVFVVTCFYTLKAFVISYTYVTLSSETEAAATAWSIEEKGEEEFIPLVKYTYLVKDVFYHGETLFYQDKTTNLWAAEDVVKNLASKAHRVWYSPKDPADSSLMKKFPLKEILSAAVLWALTLYFFWLGVYVAKLKEGS